ncbi:NAD-dependent epimerase/dehydratase family protein [Sphingobium chlorophenolicum]|uniref:GDP-6-deoxy-D-lyxo-4-hexulose reductase n=1 Tax=Sphingobium chlorophenolicum TaxID=46429 RepID=A0A081RGN3_SPHCR|nr:NAD(P)-dependent oxidoreductase [Sphingobium chlorophenolicum]KEQ54356.1 GDP-6-deoxy-D-lyxo-4-hexulose reductase [Sphingobium chlorophenolicum]
MNRILITGAGGFVGAAVADLAARQGHQVTILVRNPAGARVVALADRCTVAVGDLADRAAVRAVLTEVRPDIVIHSAWEGVGGPGRAGDIQLENIRTTVALLDEAIAQGASRFIGIGSQAEYGRHDRRIDESAATEPFLLYGAAKLSACHLTRQRATEAGIGFAWLRLFSPYGPGDNPNWLIPSVAAQIIAGRPPRTSPGTQKWDYLHIADCAQGILAAALTDGANGVFNLSSGRSVTVRSIVERIRDLACPGLALRFGDIPFGPDQIMHLEGDCSRLTDATGWMPHIAVEEGLVTVVDALRQAA